MFKRPRRIVAASALAVVAIFGTAGIAAAGDYSGSDDSGGHHSHHHGHRGDCRCDDRGGNWNDGDWNDHHRHHRGLFEALLDAF
ncbi:MAG TPA: hypothetical protein VGH89_23910 [Pseudonocardia sp.]|jgi:hypothetical protein